MSGGKISGNTANTGGGVYVYVSVEANGGSVTFTKTGGTIYGYDTGDTINSNVVKDYLDVIQSDQGHAVYTYNYIRQSNTSTKKHRETTAGTDDNLSFIGGSSPEWTGSWSED